MLTRGVALSACTDATLLAVVEGNYSTPNKALIHGWLVASARREMHKRLRWRLGPSRLRATEYARARWRLECASHATG